MLPAGRVPPNPLELLASHRFTEMMAELEKDCEIIVFDSPPIQLDIAKADRYYGEHSGYRSRYGKYGMYSKKYGYGPAKE